MDINYLKNRLPVAVRGVLRDLAFFLLKPVRSLGLKWLVRSKVSTSEVSLNGRASFIQETSKVTTFHSSETPPAPSYIDLGEVDYRHREINTFFVVIDSQHEDYSFRNNHLIAPGNRVVYEDLVPFKNLPVGLEVLETPKRFKGSVAYLSNTWVDNYYHWMCLTLPLINLYRSHLGHDPDYYYVGKPIKSWHYETLEHFGIARDKILTQAVKADRLITVIPNRKGGVDTSFLHFVRQGMLRDIPSKKPHKRLFVGRGQAKSRKLLNELACAEMLEKRFGFEYITMDGKTIEEEIDIFSQASFVISTHGSALANLLYSSPEVKVLELAPYDNSHPTFLAFYELCAFLGCTYGVVKGDLIKEKVAKKEIEKDMFIDLKKLERAVETFLA